MNPPSSAVVDWIWDMYQKGGSYIIAKNYSEVSDKYIRESTTLTLCDLKKLVQMEWAKRIPQDKTFWTPQTRNVEVFIFKPRTIYVYCTVWPASVVRVDFLCFEPQVYVKDENNNRTATDTVFAPSFFQSNRIERAGVHFWQTKTWDISIYLSEREE